MGRWKLHGVHGYAACGWPAVAAGTRYCAGRRGKRGQRAIADEALGRLEVDAQGQIVWTGAIYPVWLFLMAAGRLGGNLAAVLSEQRICWKR